MGIDTDWGELDSLAAVGECAEAVLTFGLSGDCELPEITGYLYVTPDAHAKIMFEGAAFNSYEEKYKLASIAFNPPIIQIGILTFTVDLEVVSKIEGSASSRFAVGASASVSATTGLEFGTFSGVHFDPPEPVFDFAAEGSDVTLSGAAKVGVGPQLTFKLYDVAGPYAGLYASASVDADQARTPCYDLRAGVDAEVGFVFDFPGLGRLVDEAMSFPILDESMETGSCNQPPGSSTKPPGSGPDAEHLLDPTAEPWATMVDSPVQWVPNQSNDLAWLDVSRAIDGRWVLAGAGFDAITKITNEGDLVWSRRYLDPRTEPPEPYLLQRALPTSDAGMMVVGYPYSLFKIGQGGGVYWAKRFEPSNGILETGPNGWNSEQRTFLSAVEDGQGGFIVAGSYQESDAVPSSAWLLRIDADGEVVWSRRFEDGFYLYPSSITALDDGALVAGLEWDKDSNERRMWLARIDDNGEPVWAKRFSGCTGIGYPGMQPFDTQLLTNGDVLVAGVLDLGRRSFVLEVDPEGTVRWASMQWGDDTLSSMAIHAVRELPTTGFLAAGRYHYHFEQERVFLAGLDAMGRTQWIAVYGQPSVEDGIAAGQAFPSLQLTDEGMAMMAAYTTAPMPSESSNVWVLQAQAKDGLIAFAPGAAEALTYPHATLDCPLTEESLSLTSESFELESSVFVPLVEKLQPTTTSQTASSSP